MGSCSFLSSLTYEKSVNHTVNFTSGSLFTAKFWLFAASLKSKKSMQAADFKDKVFINDVLKFVMVEKTWYLHCDCLLDVWTGCLHVRQRHWNILFFILLFSQMDTTNRTAAKRVKSYSYYKFSQGRVQVALYRLACWLAC